MNTKYIGKVNLRFDSDGRLISIDGSPILLNNEIKQGNTYIHIVTRHTYFSRSVGQYFLLLPCPCVLTNSVNYV